MTPPNLQPYILFGINRWYKISWGTSSTRCPLGIQISDSHRRFGYMSLFSNGSFHIGVYSIAIVGAWVLWYRGYLSGTYGT